MKTLKQRTIKKGDNKGELLKVVEFNKTEQKENNSRYAVTFGEYNDIDHTTNYLNEAIDFYKDWEN